MQNAVGKTSEDQVVRLNDEQKRSLATEQRIAALNDLREGCRRWPLWLTIGWLEIRQRYRRSLIGPFWITLSVCMLVGGLGLVYSSLFHMKMSEYLPFLTIGIIVWTFFAAVMNEGCLVFIASEGAIKQNPVPISVHVYRVVFRNIIILAHNALIYVVLVIAFSVKVNFALLLLPIGLLLSVVCSVGLVLIFGVFSTRFRDIPLLVTNLVQVLFFVTPILWKPQTLQVDKKWVAEVNPFYHLIELERAPLLGTVPPLESYAIATVFALATLGCGVLLYTHFCRRIAYWL